MIKKFFTVLFLLAIFIFSADFVLAEENTVPDEKSPAVSSLEPINIHLEIISGDSSLYDQDISVSACDSDNNEETEDIITAYCSVLQSGLSSSWNWDWAPGAYVDEIEGISGYTTKDKDGKDVYHYWSWSLDGTYGDVGLNQYELKLGDSILLEFIDPSEEEIIKEEGTDPVDIVETENITSRSSGHSSSVEKEFSVKKALYFLSTNQKENGSFSNDLYTDWVAIAVSGVEEGQSLKAKIYYYLMNQNFNAMSITDYERHAMALSALGINPYSGTKINYIKKITGSFDGQQLGNTLTDNDDIFGLIILQNSGYGKEDKMILKIISHIISKQLSDGSWGNVDMTSAGIMALKKFEDVKGVSDSIKKAFDYLLSKQEQNTDGGFGNPFSTSWAKQALSLDESFAEQNAKALKYFSSQQRNDGGVRSSDNLDGRIWATAYAIPAVLNLSWNDILNDFPKPTVFNLSKIQSEQQLNSINESEIISNMDDSLKNNEVPVSNLKSLSGSRIILFILAILGIILGNFVLKFKSDTI